MKVCDVHSVVAIALAVALAAALMGCGQQNEAPSLAGEPKETQTSAEQRTRVRAERKPTSGMDTQPSPARITAVVDNRSTSAAGATTQTAVAEVQATPPPSPIADVLAVLDTIPVATVDRVTTEQVLRVQGAINDLELKYKGAMLLRSDREEAELYDKIEQFNKLAEEMLHAQTPEEMREKYRQLSEGIKLYDAEIMERRRSGK